MLTKKWSILYFLLAISDQSSAAALEGHSNQQPLSFLGLHNLETGAGRGRGRTSTEQSDTTMAVHSRHGSLQTPLSQQSRKVTTAGYAGPSQGAQHQQSNSQHSTNNSNIHEVEESVLLRDLMFVFQGIDGKMVKFGAESGTCTIDLSFNISHSTRGLVNRLTELGWLYKKINQYVQKTLKEASAGLVEQVTFSSETLEQVPSLLVILYLAGIILLDYFALVEFLFRTATRAGGLFQANCSSGVTYRK